MKKLLLFMFFSMGIMVMTGCSFLGNKVVCTGKTSDMGINSDDRIEITLDGDKVKSVYAKFVYDTEDNANTICEALKSANSVASEDDKVKYTCTGTTVVINNYEKVLETANIETKGADKTTFIKTMEDEGMTCK